MFLDIIANLLSLKTVQQIQSKAVHFCFYLFWLQALKIVFIFLMHLMFVHLNFDTNGGLWFYA